MDFDFTEEQLMVRKMAKKFAAYFISLQIKFLLFRSSRVIDEFLISSCKS